MFIKLLMFSIFVISSITNVLGNAKDNKFIKNISKPLLMPSLLLLYISSTPNSNILIILALVLCFLGDVFLMRTELFIIPGLISFLIGHAFYIIALLKQVSFASLPVWLYILILPYALYGNIIYRKLLPDLKSMKLPALIYLITILTMSFSSFMRIWNVSIYNFWLPFIGSLLFISSDSMLAFNIFKRNIRWREVLVMITYIAAQFLIVAGFI